MLEKSRQNIDSEIDEIMGSTNRDFVTLSTVMNNFTKNYLYKLYTGECINNELTVKTVYGLQNAVYGSLASPHLWTDKNTGMYWFNDLFLFFVTVFRGKEYFVTFKTVFVVHYGDPHSTVQNNMFINSKGDNIQYMHDLKNIIMENAVTTSSLAHKVIRYSGRERLVELMQNMEVINPVIVHLEDIFLPAAKKMQFNRFIDAVKNPHIHPGPMRYLLNGKPGTGKTQVISAIVTALADTATVVYCSGSDLPLSSLFQFCNAFSQCVLIIDDLDFSAGERGENTDRAALSEFLQAIDGLEKNNVHLLAATNDKTLIDEAARRPGRFDLILDVGEIESQNYRDLLFRETNDYDLIEFFTEKIFSEFSARKVTGAFLVNLIKQLVSIKALNGKLSLADFDAHLNLIYQGFYGYNDKSFNSVVGFN